MAVARDLVDMSVWARAGKPGVRAALEPKLLRGLVGTSGIIDLELLFSARNADDYERMLGRRQAFEWFPTTDEIVARAIEVQGFCARKGNHRALSIPDLLVAATAERHGLTLLHYDGDFDLIAEVTGQLTEWIVPRGTAD